MLIDKEPQHKKQANDISNIIITIERIEQGQHIQLWISLLKHPLEAQHDKREDHNTIQPHRVPVVTDHIITERIGNRDRHIATAVSVIFKHIRKQVTAAICSLPNSNSSRLNGLIR